MRTPRGFLEYGREPAHARPPLERIRDWSEGHPPYSETTLRQQAARCMGCATPYCHVGELVAGAALGCPLNNLVPDWNDLVARGQWREAIVRLHLTNDFPEFTGRVCPAPCEGSCTVGLNGSPVTIKTIEVEIADRAWERGWIRPEPPVTRSGRRVAVVGSGPAGLAGASQLNRRGHAVTVFERADRIGGLLTYGIPAMKLDKGVVERRVELLAAEGISFVTGVEVGREPAATDLLGEFDAVVLATGSTRARDLPVPGRELTGIHPAMDFLVSGTRQVLTAAGDPGIGPLGPGTPHADGPVISAAGRDVVVIGGGDTGTDCVATAIRQGARSLVQLEILPRPPDGRAADNPWPLWPRTYKLDYGQEEAAALWGTDPRRFGVTTRRFLGDESGRLVGLETAAVEWLAGPDGRAAPREVPGTEQILAADLVLLAMGFLGPERSLPEQLGCDLRPAGTILTDAAAMTTTPGVFAAGDCARGQSLVVWAIREGRRAAVAVDRYLAGETAGGR
ncbi:MAG: glutamate synthase subunit beta [Chloroflexi bacterium]|nr:glutamate synthase subunit beta [Chloroflexota bacterium]